MSTLFFDHLVIKEELDFELNSYQLTSEEREELLEIIDEILIHQILNLVLNFLPKDTHEEFTALLHQSPHDESLLEYLKNHANPEIESEIKKHASKIKSEILSEIRKHRKKK